jgi:hypothetical protein
MASFLYKTFLHTKNVTYSELKLKHLKIIQKCLIGEPDSDIVLLNINNIFSEITNLTKEEINELNLIDYFILLSHIRSMSIGNIVYAELTQQKNVKLNINIEEIIKQLSSIDYKNLLKDDTLENGITVKYKLPTPNELSQLQTNDIETFCIPFIESIIINGTEFKIYKFNTDEKIQTIQKLPAKVISNLYKKIYSLLEIYSKTNLLEHIKGVSEFIPFSFNIKSYISLITLLYGDQLLSLYDNIFLLCKFGNFTPEYIEECTPGEYYIFCRKLETYMAKKQEAEQQAPSGTGYDKNFSDGFIS